MIAEEVALLGIEEAQVAGRLERFEKLDTSQPERTRAKWQVQMIRDAEARINASRSRLGRLRRWLTEGRLAVSRI